MGNGKEHSLYQNIHSNQSNSHRNGFAITEGDAVNYVVESPKSNVTSPEFLGDLSWQDGESKSVSPNVKQLRPRAIADLVPKEARV